MSKKAVVLFSGGIDSTLCLKLAQEQGFVVYALSFDYGQGHIAELKAAKKIAALCKVVEHKILSLPLAALGGSALTDKSIAIPDYQHNNKIQSTYVPARNTVFLSMALAYAEVVGANDIFTGPNAMDRSGFPDCRPEYIAAFQHMATLATRAGVEGQLMTIHAPLLALSKADIMREAVRLGIDFSQTVSCYRADENGLACGTCSSCVLRKEGLREAGLQDTTHYKN